MALGQELRDFISAWQAGAKIMAAHDDAEYKKLRTKVEQAKLDKELDPERNKLETDAMRLKLDQSRASIARSNASTALSNKRGAILDERLRELKSGPKSAIPDVDPDLIGGAASRRGEYGTAPGKQSALDIGQPSLASYDDEEEEDAALAQFAARGGAIRHYADGGLVEDEEDFDDEDAGWDESALPSSAQPTQGRGTPGYSPMAANDAVRDGLNYGAQSLGVSRRSGTGGLSKSAAQRYAEGYGAASPREVEAVKKAIDPEGRLSESQRALAALGTVYSHYLARGDTRAAQSAAFSLLQNYRVMSQRYAAIAAIAAQDGNIDEAAKAAIKAYENIPDGRDLRVMKNADGSLSYSIVDAATNKVINKGIASPQQLAAQAMRVSQNGFDEFILRAAGERASAPKKDAGKGAGGLKISDRMSVEEAIDGAWDRFTSRSKEAGSKDEDIAKMPADALKSVAGAAYPNNKNMSADDVLLSVRQLALPDPNNLHGANYKTSRMEDGSGYRVKFSDGRTMQLDEGSFERLMLLRHQKIKELEPEWRKEAGVRNSEKDTRERIGEEPLPEPGWADGIYDRVKGAVGALPLNNLVPPRYRSGVDAGDRR